MDFDSYKNMVGAFHQPSLVYMNLNTLKTLDAQQFACGMGEILKHGLIKNADYYEWLINHMMEINDRFQRKSCQAERRLSSTMALAGMA